MCPFRVHGWKRVDLLCAGCSATRQAKPIPQSRPPVAAQEKEDTRYMGLRWQFADQVWLQGEPPD